MKIEKQQLIELLVVKTGLDQKSIEKQLDELVGRIRDAADRGKALEVKGFGLFYYSETGDLKFDPSEEFKTEVNFKYTGMEPIEVQEAHAAAGVDEIITGDEPNAEISEEVEDEDIWGEEPEVKEKKEEDAAAEKEYEAEESSDASESEISDKEKKETESPEVEDTGEAGAEEETEKEETTEGEFAEENDEKNANAFEELIGDAFSTLDEEEKEEEKDSAEKDDLEDKPVKTGDSEEPEKVLSEKKSIDDYINDSDSEEEVKSEKTEQSKKKPARYPKKPGKRFTLPEDESHAIPINMVIIGLSVLIVIVVGYFVVSDLTSSQSPVSTPTVAEQQTERNGGSQQTVQESDEADEGQAAEDAEESGETGETAAAENGQEQTTADESQAEGETGLPSESGEELQEDSPVYGLRGTINETISDGYTIIVHSLRDEDNARQAMQRLREEGYRAMVYSRELPETGFVWRVGIGQFETLENARNVADNLPDPLNENNFIQRIQ
jgi:cell division septation protein DedD